jgi:hypothetical protein
MVPSPLWAADGSDARQTAFYRPRLFAFQSDAFMDDFIAAAAAKSPNRLKNSLAQPAASSQTLKLFQPSHGAFYLVGASLCCRFPGFPDRVVRTAEGERASFVVRKLIDGDEYGWVPDETGSNPKKKTWMPLNGAGNVLLKDEERQPLFPVPAGNGRTILAGYVSVASRETYSVPPAELAMTEPLDVRLQELGSRFSTPVEEVQTPQDDRIPPNSTISLEQSAYLYLELWEFFDTHLKDVAAALKSNLNATFSGPKASAKTALMTFLKNEPLGGSIKLANALQLAAQKRDQLNQPGGVGVGALTFTQNHNLHGRNLSLETLYDRVEAALPDEGGQEVELPKLETRADALYVLRCVYERPQCEPPKFVVSRTSDPFQLAPFFDPDAPARPIKIPLPTDVSIGGLRKFKPNVTFLMSDAMRKKMNSIVDKEKTLLDDSPELNPPDSGEFAFICSFSIQIIFIVAFFLLLMFVIILNFVFWWIAFFKICLPIPKRLLPE